MSLTDFVINIGVRESTATPKMPELREESDPDWVTVTLSEALPVQDHSQKPYSDHTLPAVKMKCVPGVLHLLTCSY
jgi:hypothetical protein